MLRKELGDLPIIAENLGVITPEVEAIRHEFGFPGMAILQFAFGNDPQAPTFKPHNYVRDLVAYTGTHDNDTVVGWWNQRPRRQHAHARRRRQGARTARAPIWDSKTSPSTGLLSAESCRPSRNTAIAPMQDILGLGSEARMNLPGAPSGNWKWRMKAGRRDQMRSRPG